MGLIDKTLGKAVNFTFNSVIKGGKGIIKGASILGDVSEKLVTGAGDGIIKIGHGINIGKNAIEEVAETVNDGVEYLSGKRIPKPSITKDIAEDAMEDQTLYGRLIGKTLNPAGIGLLTVGTMGASTINAVAQNGGEKLANLGYVEAGENLDRLISYDGSGFMNRINEVSGNDYEVMNDIVSNTFTEGNQFGADGSIVFALHNMREG